MKATLSQLLKNLYINQNFIWLVVAYIGVWFAQGQNYTLLYWASFVLFVLTGLSVGVCLIAYTIEYWCKKYCKAQEYKIDYQSKLTKSRDNT